MATMPRIRVTPNGGSELQPLVDELLALRPSFAEAGVALEEFHVRMFDPISTIAISIAGVVAEKLIKELLEVLLRPRNSVPSKEVRITVHLAGRSYTLPQELKSLQNALDESKSERH